MIGIKMMEGCFLSFLLIIDNLPLYVENPLSNWSQVGNRPFRKPAPGRPCGSYHLKARIRIGAHKIAKASVASSTS